MHAYWNGSSVRSRLFDALSLILPAAETFLIDTLDNWRASVPLALQPALAHEIDRFIREECAHRRAHERYNAALIAALPAAAVIAERAAQVTRELDRFSLPMRLALVAAFEQLTALLSHEIVHRHSLIGPSDAPQAQMWRWHAREELAHCDVAVTAAAIGGPAYPFRAAALLLATLYLLTDIVRYTRALCRCDLAAGESRRRLAVDTLRFTFGSAPSLARMWAGWLRHAFTPLRAKQ
jgi:predicted metal-dependent hydrolase